MDPHHPLWPPSLPPPFASCAPHLDHGLYEPQLRRWLTFFRPSQFLLVSFAGYTRRPAAVVRDVLVHARIAPAAAALNSARDLGARVFRCTDPRLALRAALCFYAATLVSSRCPTTSPCWPCTSLLPSEKVRLAPVKKTSSPAL